MKRKAILTLLVFLTACQSSPQATPLPTETPTRAPTRSVPTPGARLEMANQPTVTPEATATARAESTPAQIPTSTTQRVTPISNEWMNLPALPAPNENIRSIYERGLELGNDPHAFSIFGDCQTQPDEFFGIYETDPALVETLPPKLQETIAHFDGSFSRESSTSQDGTTPGALLWDQWHRGAYGCTFAETPVECELRVHRPSFVIIQVGTHFESRNTEYLRKIITQLINRGVVPILATKADNRELNHRVNRDMALLASEFNLP
ncbi:MAG: hypothetical protein Q8L87_09925, partial [Anaerolineales bacterium]|nr:hypothetical protein [Anaerolineales bacterium]